MSTSEIKAIVIGASAGAVETLFELMPALPANFPLPIMVVVHIPPDKESLLPQILTARSKIAIKEAEDKEPIKPSTVYFAPPDYHLLVEANGSLSLSNEEPELFSRPSINALFESAADAYGPQLMGIVLTGANSDGTRGLQLIEEAGGMVITQTAADAHEPTMPLSAFNGCKNATQMTMAQLREYLQGISS